MGFLVREPLGRPRFLGSLFVPAPIVLVIGVRGGEFAGGPRRRCLRRAGQGGSCWFGPAGGGIPDFLGEVAKDEGGVGYTLPEAN
jgi:hypothetical protein